MRLTKEAVLEEKHTKETKTIGNRYLYESPDEKVYALYEQHTTNTEYLGRVVVNKHSVIIYRGNDKMTLTWDDIALINLVKPQGAVEGSH